MVMHLMVMIIVSELEIDSIKANAKKGNNSLGVTNAYKAHRRGNQRDNYFQISQRWGVNFSRMVVSYMKKHWHTWKAIWIFFKCSYFKFFPLSTTKWNVVWCLLYKFILEVTVTLYMCSKTPCSWLNCHWWGHFQNTRWLMARSLFIANCSQLFET